eukprot:3430218-Amphidinium_carterae.2
MEFVKESEGYCGTPGCVQHPHNLYIQGVCADSADADNAVKRLPPKLAMQVVTAIEKVVIPLAKQRTNVGDPSKPDLRSDNLGAYTTRGCGVTKYTTEWPEVVKSSASLSSHGAVAGLL